EQRLYRPSHASILNGYWSNCRRDASALSNRAGSLTRACELSAEKSRDVIHSYSSLRRDFKDLHAGTNSLNIAASRSQIELRGLGEIHLRDDGDIGAVKYGGILQRLILPLGSRKQNKTDLFSQVVAGWADQIPDILNKEKVDLIQFPRVQSILDHLRVEMTNG